LKQGTLQAINILGGALFLGLLLRYSGPASQFVATVGGTAGGLFSVASLTAPNMSNLQPNVGRGT
jgi:hypothetical protein